jgi:ElaB/YqjD/DUF883 family membrane-anchored ribosome-binding protein
MTAMHKEAVATNPDLQEIMNDIASLKEDIAKLAGHLKNSAIDTTAGAARSVVGQLSDEAARIYESLAAQGERSAKTISRQVEEQPMTSLLVAFALGFVGSRLLSR